MATIIFTEARELLHGRIVQEGEEVDLGDVENAAFVQNGVAKFADAVEAPPAAVEETEYHG